MGVILYNNALSTLAADISEASGTLTVASGDGALFPTVSPGDYFYCTLVDVDGNMEIVKVTGRTVDVFTIVRAQESTLAVSFAAGAKVELRITAQSVLDAVTAAVGDLSLSDFGITASVTEINTLDGLTASVSELNILDGILVSTNELNLLDGVTVGATELNKLDGLTASTAELNTLDGITATVSDLNKLTGLTASTAELNKLSGVTATTAEFNKLAGLTSSTAELNILDGVVATTAQINYLSNVTSDIQAQINSFATFPAGAILPYAGSSAPAGWLLCNGQAVSRTTYATLFGISGTAYGSGNGSTTFNVPDLRGRVPAGLDNMGGSAANRLTGTSGGVTGSALGNFGGLETHKLTIPQLPAHKHLDGYAQDGSAGSYGNATGPSTEDMSFSGSSTSHPYTSSVGSDAAHNNVQPTLIVNYIIKT